MNISILINFIGETRICKYGFAELAEQAGKEHALEKLYLDQVKEQGYGYTNFRDMYPYQYDKCLIIGAEAFIEKHSPRECLDFLNIKLEDLKEAFAYASRGRQAEIEKLFA